MQASTTLTSLSPLSNKPCLLLSFPSCKILFDCALDFYPMNYYASSSVISKTELDLTDFPSENVNRALSHTRKNNPEDEKDSFHEILPNGSLLEAIPEVNFHFVSNIDLSQIDAVFISNWESIKGLPFLIDNPKFRCPIYSSEPVISLGGMIVEEIIHFLERVDKSVDDKQWVNVESWNKAIGEDRKKTIPYQWKSFYTKEMLLNALSKITRVSINQLIKVSNTVNVSLFPSGFEIGSCNWRITNGSQKIGYWAASSIQKGYMREMETKPFSNLNCLIISSLSNKTIKPNNVISEMCSMTVNTLQKGGNVLFPMEPVGSVYGIIENLVGEMDKRECNFPIYLISPVASRALAWTNISGEWFNNERREWLFEPKMPFHLSEFIEKKRLFLYNSIHSDFSTQYTIPCVVFTGHPSLRMGDAVYFTELWGSDKRSVVMLTNPEYDFDKVWLPFSHLLIKPMCYPIDMRLTVHDVKNLLLSDVKTPRILISDEYSDSFDIVKNKTVLYKFAQTTDLITVNDIIRLSCYDENVKEQAGINGGVAQGYLNHFDTNFELTTVHDLKTADPSLLLKFRNSAADIGGLFCADLPFQKRLKGDLSPQNLKAAFEREKHPVISKSNRDGSTTIVLNTLSAEIILKQKKTKVNCSNPANRRLIVGILDKLLKSLMSDK